MNNVWEVQIVEYLSEKEFQNIDFIKKKKNKTKHQNIDTCKNMEFFLSNALC